MSLGAAETFGVALMMLWGTAGAVALGRAVAKSPAMREFAAGFRKRNLAAKGALVAGLVGAVAIGGTKPAGRDAPTARPSGGRFVETSLPAPPFALVEVRTNGVAFVAASTNAIVSESVRLHGTSEGGEWIEADAPFFLWGTNPVARAFASLAVLSFGTMRHPALGVMLPDGSSAESLVALRTPLGFAPEANWPQLAAPSRFWHEETAFGRVFTWENALLDRLADRPATIQMEARDIGDFVYRYDFSAASPTNEFFIGAQLGPAAVEALGVRGGVTNAATVYRVDGAPIPDGASVADLFSAPRLEMRWKNVAGLGDLSGDTDGDGLTDWQETFLHGTDPRRADTDGDGIADGAEVLAEANPLDADEDGDGVPDGISAEIWAANPLWATNAPDGAARIAITLNDAIPANETASLLVADLCIPLREPATWTLGLVPGTLYSYRLVVNGETCVNLSVEPGNGESPMTRGAFLRQQTAPSADVDPLWEEGAGGVFDGTSRGGEGNMAVPTLELEWIDSEEDYLWTSVGVCLHGNKKARFSWKILPVLLSDRIPGLDLTNLCLEHGDLALTVTETASAVEGIASLPEGSFRFGRLFAIVRAHLCDADYQSPECSVCGLHQFLYDAWHDIDYLTVVPDGLPNGQDIVRFPGSQTRTFNPASSPVPDLHQPFFYEDAKASDLDDCTSAHVNAFMSPDDPPPAEASFEWRCVEGLANPFPQNGWKTSASFVCPLAGGVYRFRFRCGAIPPSDAVLVLPLAGASVDDIVAAEIAHADSFAENVNSRYVLVERNLPINGLRWFWNDGAGDFLGRPDNVSSPTVWYYNQVNDDTGMGAVCTWEGQCVRVAKLSNFICGYACRKIGVAQLFQTIAQSSGTANDMVAGASWGYGEALADGTMSLERCADHIGWLSWLSEDQKVRRLWPNDEPADNFVSPDSYHDPNTQFTAPGFLYMENP